MKRIFIILWSLFLFVTGYACNQSSDDLPECLIGTIIGIESCSNAVLIRIENYMKLGNKITYYNGTEYDNVIKTPAVPGTYKLNEKIYFNYRFYNRDKDYHLFEPVQYPCPMDIIPFRVPIVVITSISTSQCPKINE